MVNINSAASLSKNKVASEWVRNTEAGQATETGPQSV